MLRLLACALLIQISVQGQGLPYGVPPPLPLSARPGVPPTIPPLNPTVYPFGSTVPPFPGSGIPGIPGVPGVPPGVIPPPGVRNPYYNYNPAVGPAVPILTYSNNGPSIDGAYEFSFSTADGKQAQENGYLKDAYIDNNGEPQGTQVVTGSYAYIAPDGTPIQVSYVADENGFRPSGVHILANGKGAALPDLFNGNYTRNPFDPAYRYNNPYNYRNQYNNNYNNNYNNYNNNPYNSALRYDPARYDPARYDPARYNPYNNGYRPNWYSNQKRDNVETLKKD